MNEHSTTTLPCAEKTYVPSPETGVEQQPIEDLFKEAQAAAIKQSTAPQKEPL